MEFEEKILLTLLAEGGGVDIFKSYKGLYQVNQKSYITFKEAFLSLNPKGNIHGLTPQYVDVEIRNELTSIINELLKDGAKLNSNAERDWEIWLNRKLYSTLFGEEAEYQEMYLLNEFGPEHKELHFLLEKMLREYLHFQNMTNLVKPNSYELNQLLEQHSINGHIYWEYGERLLGWCVDAENERLNPICGYGEEEFEKIKPNKKIITNNTIEASHLNSEINQREISLSKFSILLKESTFQFFKKNLIDRHLKHCNQMLSIISGEKNGYFPPFKPMISAVIFTQKATDYQSQFGKKDVFYVDKILSENPLIELYDYPSARFDHHRIWRQLYTCFGLTISYGCLYDTLRKSGFDKNQSLKLSGLGSETHLSLSQLLRENYTCEM